MKIKYIFIDNNKPWVLFLHGWGGNENSFVELYNLLANNYSVVAINLSDITTNYLNKPLTMYDYVIAVGVILQKLKINNCHIVCHSFGFRVALLLNYLKVINLLSIVIIDGAGIKDNSVLVKLKILKFKLVKLLVKIGILSKNILNKFGSDDYKNLNDITKQTFKNIVNYDLKKYIKYIKCKCTIVWGKHDKVTKLKCARYISRKVKNSKVFIYSVGHFSYMENSVEFIFDMIEHFGVN